MPFFGDNTIRGPSGHTLNIGGLNFEWALRASPATNGTVYQITVYGAGQSGTNANLYTDIYSDDGAGTAPVNLLATTVTPFLVTTDMAPQWMSMPVTLSITAGTTYWLGMRLTNVGGISGMTIYDAALAGSLIRTFDQQTDPASNFHSSFTDESMSIYADYAQAAGDDPAMHLLGMSAGRW